MFLSSASSSDGRGKAMAPKAHSLPRFAAAALLLLATAVVVQLETAGAQDDPCIPFDETCKADTVCRACQEAVGPNLEAFEECQLYYGFQEDPCINQSAQACCQDDASSNDCLANVAYTDFYECRLSLDVFGGECTVLDCDAVDANKPSSLITETTTSDSETEAPTAAPTDVDPADANTAGRLAPSLLARTTGNGNGAGFVVTAGLSAAAVLAAAFA